MAWVNETESCWLVNRTGRINNLFFLQQLVRRGVFLSLCEVSADLHQGAFLFILKQNWCVSVINQCPWQCFCFVLQWVLLCQILVKQTFIFSLFMLSQLFVWKRRCFQVFVYRCLYPICGWIYRILWLALHMVFCCSNSTFMLVTDKSPDLSHGCVVSATGVTCGCALPRFPIRRSHKAGFFQPWTP